MHLGNVDIAVPGEHIHVVHGIHLGVAVVFIAYGYIIIGIGGPSHNGVAAGNAIAVGGGA